MYKLAVYSLLLLPFAVKLPDRTFIRSEVDSVVFLESDIGRCSGSIIRPGVVLTAAHCVEGSEGMWATFDDGSKEYFEAIIVGVSGSRFDIALLIGNTKDAIPLKLADELPLPSMCFMWGFAGTPIEMFMPCTLEENDILFGVMGRGEARPGDSGGPVIGKDGKLVGVIWGSNGEDGFIIAPLDAVQMSLEALDAALLE